jgi:hypothetical protein
VHIVYIDDAGTTGRDLENPEQPIQVVVAVIIDDLYFTTISSFLKDLHERVKLLDPESTELHGLDLFRKNKDAMWECLSLVEGLGLPVVYGAVDKPKLATQLYSSADPLTMAIQMCGDGVSDWFHPQVAQTNAHLKSRREGIAYRGRNRIYG